MIITGPSDQKEHPTFALSLIPRKVSALQSVSVHHPALPSFVETSPSIELLATFEIAITVRFLIDFFLDFNSALSDHCSCTTLDMFSPSLFHDLVLTKLGHFLAALLTVQLLFTLLDKFFVLLDKFLTPSKKSNNAGTTTPKTSTIPTLQSVLEHCGESQRTTITWST